MPHHAERVRSTADRRGVPLPGAAGPQPRRNGPQRSALWHVLQLKAAQAAQAPAPGVQSRSALPARLKAGVEALSGIAMDDVRVHRDSPEPARLGALAYAQGSDIHLGPGQDRHLPHEAWHVVQQKQGRVGATAQLKGVALNEDSGLEREADAMGAKALAARADSPMPASDLAREKASPAQAVAQRMSVFGDAVAAEVSDETYIKHVVATNDQAAAAKDNYGSTTYVTSTTDLKAAVDANNWDFRVEQSSYRYFYANLTVSVYSKTGDMDAGKPVSRTVNNTSTNAQIGVTKSRSGRIRVTHLKSA